MAPFVASIRSREMTDVENVLDLPNTKNLDWTIACHQTEIAHTIIKVSEAEMRITMTKEIKCTIITEKGEAYYDELINLPIQEREIIVLVILYAMGWQCRLSGYAYNSISGHAFAIRQYTIRIIDCVVYSISCKNER